MTTPSSRKPRVRVSARNPHFFKVFLPHLSSQNLRIPPKFRKHIDEEKSPVTVSLKGPSGRIWLVELTKNSDGMFFDNGWNGFVTDHSLVLGDFLVFRYDGKLVFDVMVFDTTACEKDEAFVAVPCQDGIIVLDTDDDGEEAAPKALVVARNGSVRVSLKRSRGNDDLQKKLSGIARKKRCDHQPWIFRKSKTRPHSTKVMNSRALVARSSSSSKKSRPVRPKKGNQIVDAKEKHKDKISQRRPITEKPSRAQENSNSFKSRNPFCKIEMTHTYVHQGFFMMPKAKKRTKVLSPLIALYLCHLQEEDQGALFKIIPRSFAKEYLPRGMTKTNLTLWDPNGKSWKVKYISRGRCGAFSAGWKHFACYHNLQIGDVCIFELIDKYHLRVHFFRMVNENNTPLLSYWEVGA